MRAVVQRVKRASVTVETEKVSNIGPGLLTFLGIANGDDENTLIRLIEKICTLRVFEDDQGKLGRSLKDVGGSHLIVSQFTLLGDCSRGTRPSFSKAAAPDFANELYEKAIAHSLKMGIPTFGGKFRAHMNVELINDGPVTLILET